VAGAGAVGLALALLLVAAFGDPARPQILPAAAQSDVRILLGEPSTIDPAAQGDIGSAGFTAQLFESLTAFDSELVLRPALAASWDVLDGGRRVVFHLRTGLTFSDGTPIHGGDVVRSWLRIIDPDAPSPLASLMSGVRGADDYLQDVNRDPLAVGLSADDNDVSVDLERPGADFPAIVAGPTFAIVPPGFDGGAPPDAEGFVGSGGYVLAAVTPTEYTLEANSRYWAGAPAIRTAHLITDVGGRSAVAVFEDDLVDYTGIGAHDAAWIRYDETLGPHLRLVPSLSLSYLGFDAGEAPFDDVRVRQAFGAAIDWARVTGLGAANVSRPAQSMVPPGIPGAPGGSWLPAHDPDAARALLRAVGYPNGAGFPDIAFGTGYSPFAEAIAAELERELAVTVNLEAFDDHYGRLATDPPAMFTIGWVADYPAPNDFLGVLLRSGSTNDYGRWSSGEFDAAIDAALATAEPAAAEAAWRRVLEIIQSDVPVVPLVTGDGWALSRNGLLGASQNGLGLLRVAGLAWAMDE
jgi:ABC-type transport system substrate-binding protein